MHVGRHVTIDSTARSAENDCITILNSPPDCAIRVSVAVKVVNNILLGSQAIVGLLHRSGLNLEQIARVAPKIQVG